MINLSIQTRYGLAMALMAVLLLTSPLSQAQKLSPAEAAASARNATGGKVLKVKAMKGKKVDYRVKMLMPEGRVRHIIIDGDSGRLQPRRKHLPPTNKKPHQGLR